jgi:hypothetical protein
MADEVDHPALVRLIAPRPLIAENAEDDLIFPLDAAKATIAQSHASYAAAGAPEAIELFVTAGDHHFDGMDSLPALIQALSR